MPGYDTARDTIARQLSTEYDKLTCLLGQLEHEKILLSEDDMASLMVLQDEKRESVSVLRDMAAQRDQVLNASGTEGEDLWGRLAQIDPTGDIERNFRRNLELARQCRDRNIENGWLVNRREAFVTQSLAVLRAETGQGTYSASGRHGEVPGLRQLGSA